MGVTWVWLAVGVGVLAVMQTRLVDGGGSGLLSQRGWLLLMLAFPPIAFLQEGWAVGSVMTLAVVGILIVVFMPTPSWLRRANWLRARSVREAVANSRTIWDSYDYRSSDPP